MNQRSLIIGLDSATFDVIDGLIGEGRLPNLAEICRCGVRSRMLSTFPPRTAPAWVTCMTGQNPGMHGVFDFWFRRLEGYDLVETGLVTTASYAGRTVFDVLSRSGKRVAALFVPMTFPAWDVNGVMVAGPPLTPESVSGICHPPAKYQELGIKHDLHLHPPSLKDPRVQARTVKDLLDMENARAQAALQVWQEEDADCLMFVLEALDIVQHRLWKAFKQGGDHPFKDTIPRFYENVDRIIGRFMGAAGEDDLLFVISDHGMTAHPEVSFNTNAWLASAGWLRFSSRKARSSQLLRSSRDLFYRLMPQAYDKLKESIKGSGTAMGKKLRMASQGGSAIDWAKTAAWRIQMADPPLDGIMLNIEGRQPQGLIQPHRAQQTAQQIADSLLQVKEPSSGLPVVRKVYSKEEVYRGPYADEAPDLVVEFQAGFKADAGLHSGVFSATPAKKVELQSGTHSPQGIFLARGKPFAPGIEADLMGIADFAPMLLYSMGHSIPSFMDGRVHPQFFKTEFFQSHPPQIQEIELESIAEQAGYTAQEEAEMEDKLKNLGYL